MTTKTKTIKGGTIMEKWIKFTRDSFATDEDWETLCEEVDADPESTQSIKIYIAKADIED